MRQLKITKQVTNRETASLDKYLQEIGKVDLITADEDGQFALGVGFHIGQLPRAVQRLQIDRRLRGG